MAVTTTQTRVTCTMRLNAGIDADGKRILKNVSLGSLKTNAFDAQKAQNIVNLLMPCMAYSLYQVQNQVTNLLEDDGE